MAVSNAEVSGHKVITAKDIRHDFEGKPIVNGLSLKIMRGDRIGIAGPNGCGKTTLIRILLGKLEPGQGSVELGTKLEIAYFDQLRDTLLEEETVQFNVNDGKEFIEMGNRKRHVNGYLQDFLFPPQRALSPVRSLSGGEKNRLILAKLFARPSNFLVLDEPTNDLDAETLELLEERLMDYEGTVILVSHDRTFLENIVTSTLVFQTDGQIVEYWSDCETWIPKIMPRKTKRRAKPSERRSSREGPRKLTFKETRELEALPPSIEELESEQANIIEDLADPGFFKEDDGTRARKAKERLNEIDEALKNAFNRWEALEDVKRNFEEAK